MANDMVSPLGAAFRASFASFIEERTREFWGREWVFEKLNDWLADTNAGRFFLLTGGPGTGKSAIASRLAHWHSRAAPASTFAHIHPGFLSYFHFCQAGSDTTLAATNFVQALAETLASRHEVYRNALLRNPSQQFSVNVNVGTAEAGANVTGVALNIFSGSTRPLFNALVRAPLLELCASTPALRIIILSILWTNHCWLIRSTTSREFWPLRAICPRRCVS